MYIFKKGKIPDPKELNKLEEKFFINTKNFEKKNIKKLKNKILNNNIKYLTRSELYCDYSNKKCALIKNNDKLYSDYGHLTDNGARYFSNQGEIIMNKLIK